jgi:hypothetical protein
MVRLCRLYDHDNNVTLLDDQYIESNMSPDAVTTREFRLRQAGGAGEDLFVEIGGDGSGGFERADAWETGVSMRVGLFAQELGELAVGGSHVVLDPVFEHEEDRGSGFLGGSLAGKAGGDAPGLAADVVVKGGVEAATAVALLEHGQFFGGEVVLEVGNQKGHGSTELFVTLHDFHREQDLVGHGEQSLELAIDVSVSSF